MTNKQQCNTCEGTGEENFDLQMAASRICKDCNGTGEQPSKFSNFIRNASDEEANEVMTKVMEKASKDQEQLIQPQTMRERFDKNIPKEVGEDKYFGYKIEIIEEGLVKSIFTITDWENIKSFINQEIALAKQEERERLGKTLTSKWYALKQSGKSDFDTFIEILNFIKAINQ